MNASIKVLTVITKVAKNGKNYREIWASITIDGVEFVRKFITFT